MKYKKKDYSYLNDYERIELIQPLAHDRYMKQIYRPTRPNEWVLIYETNSAYHICPYDGVFRSCDDCGAGEENFDMGFCESKTIYVDNKELAERIKDCEDGGLEVKKVR